ncbi:mucin-13-like [Sardina pilchardus]|uniref:mucin-13-like n=1 Tax=Sardina pilchardus TaxID=27697 RepID=UPI002E10B032
MKTLAKVLMVCWLVAAVVQGTTPDTSTLDPLSSSSPTPDSTSSLSPDASSPPTPDASSSPTPEASSSPTPDASSPPTPDASSPPTPEATSPPTSDATSPPSPDATSPPSPDATSPPSPDATSPPSPDATSPPSPDATSPPSPDATSLPSPDATSSSPVDGATSPSTSAPDTVSPNTAETSPNTAETSSPDVSTPPPTTARPDPCLSNSCPEDSRCEPRFDSYVCVCLTGLVLQDNTCKKANVFPADIRIIREFTEAMKDKTSEEFKKNSDEIVAELQKTLTTTDGYITSTVLSLRNGSVIADVQNIYNSESSITAEEVKVAFHKAAECPDCLFAGATLSDTKLCAAPDACDLLSTTCSEADGKLSCDCKSGYVKTNFTDRSCSVCPSGFEAKDNECVSCSFGYSGVNCQESYMLAVVVVSCVLGGLLLILIIVLIVICCKKSKKSSHAKNSPYVDIDFRNKAVPKIPRANANSKGWEPTNLELVESGSTRALVLSDRQSNGMKNFGNQTGIAYRTHGHVNPYFQSNEGH